MKKYKYNDNERNILEFHDFMCDDSNDIRIPPVVMKGYTPIKQPWSANTKLEVKAISFGLLVGSLYAVAAFFGLSE